MSKNFTIKLLAKVCLIILHIVFFFEYLIHKIKHKMLNLKRYTKLGIIDTTILYMISFSLLGAMIALILVGFIELKSSYIVAGSIIGALAISLIIVTDSNNYGRK